jgi:NAD(P)-dependent dehydrogenase (short-subunit alcohol dehydrogenase family)
MEMDPGVWNEMIDINLTGVWHTVRAGAPSMIEAGNGGSIVLTSSTAGLKGFGMCAHYSAAKHGVVGLMRSLANELSEHRIRVNSVHPASCNTDMIQNEATYNMFRPDLESASKAEAIPAFESLHMLPDLPWIEPIDISNAILWLASDEARYVTGVALPVDAGFTEKV